jgi:hypothetical protein
MTKRHASPVPPKCTSFAGALGDAILSSAGTQEILDVYEIGGAS